MKSLEDIENWTLDQSFDPSIHSQIQSEFELFKSKLKILLNPKKERVYINGGFDLLHSGHYNAIRQAKNLSDVLVVGVVSDEQLIKNKGPVILSCEERTEILRHCKFVDELRSEMEYSTTFETLKKVDCQFYAHGDDPVIDCDGHDVIAMFKNANAFKEFKRTEGVSTTEITGRLLALAKNTSRKEGD